MTRNRPRHGGQGERMKKELLAGCLAVVLVLLWKAEGAAQDQELKKAIEDSYVQEFPELGLVREQMERAEEKRAAKNGTLAGLVEDKVAQGQEVEKDEMMEALAESVSTDAEKTFKAYIADPVPQTVKIIEGASQHWQGFSASLVFTADPATFDELKLGYDRIPFEGIKPLVAEWFTEDISHKADILVYFRHDNLNKYYLLLDPSTGKIFFKGLSA